MSRTKNLLVFGVLIGASSCAGDICRHSLALAQDSPDGALTRTDPKSPADDKVRKTDQEWRKLLTRNQYLVTRQKETEAPFTGVYSRGHFNGTFVCVCCEADLFSSRTKFESGTGWPSFWQPISKNVLSTQIDDSTGERRIEVMCRRCDAHLGHVFDDGPAPTGLRYCMNSLALKLRPAANAKGSFPKTKAKSRNS